jgi:hypothetical protein
VKQGNDKIQEKGQKTNKEGKHDNEEISKREKVSLEAVARRGRGSDRGNKRKRERNSYRK